MGISLSKLETPVVLFVVGKTGHGKSLSGNTILGKNVFKTSNPSTSVSRTIETACTIRDGTVIKVVDGPGLCDVRPGAAEKSVQCFEEGVAECLEGISALVLVYKIGIRFTEEEKKCVDTLKILFGKDFVRNHCVLVFTHGEQFDREQTRKKTNMTFEDWCRSQTRPLKDLMNECQNRAVLFYNLSKDEVKRKAVEKFFEKVQQIPKIYTNKMFQKEKEARETFVVESNAPELKEGVKIGLDLLMDELKRIDEMADDDELSKQMALSYLMIDVADFERDASEIAKGTDIFVDLHKSLSELKVNIKLNLKNCQEHLEKIRDRVYDRRKRQQRIILGVFTMGVSEIVFAIKRHMARSWENQGYLSIDTYAMSTV